MINIHLNFQVNPFHRIFGNDSNYNDRIFMSCYDLKMIIYEVYSLYHT